MSKQFMWKAARSEHGQITYYLSGEITENSPIKQFAGEIQAFTGMTILLTCLTYTRSTPPVLQIG